MRIGLDATPLLGARTGIGRYVAELVRHLPEALGGSDELVTTAFTLRGAGGLAGQLPPGVSARNTRIPARVLSILKLRHNGCVKAASMLVLKQGLQFEPCEVVVFRLFVNETL